MMKKIIIAIMFCSFMLHAQTPADMKITLQDIEQLEQQYVTLKNEHLRETTTFHVMKIHWNTKVPALQDNVRSQYITLKKKFSDVQKKDAEIEKTVLEEAVWRAQVEKLLQDVEKNGINLPAMDHIALHELKRSYRTYGKTKAEQEFRRLQNLIEEQKAITARKKSMTAETQSMAGMITQQDINDLKQQFRSALKTSFSIEDQTQIQELEFMLLKKDYDSLMRHYMKMQRLLKTRKAELQAKKLQEDTPARKRQRLYAKAMSGNIPALLELHDSKDPRALTKLKELASKDNLEAQYIIGRLYLQGRGVERSEMLAERYFKQGALKNHQGCIDQLYKMYSNKSSSKYDLQKSLQIMEKWAEDGKKDAMILIARYADAGIFMKPDSTKAARYYQKLANMDYIPALGYCMEHGLNGEKVDLKGALELYYDCAISSKNIDAAYRYIKLKVKLDVSVTNRDKDIDQMIGIADKHPGLDRILGRQAKEDSGDLYAKLDEASKNIFNNRWVEENVKVLEELQTYDLPDAYLYHAIYKLCGNRHRSYAPTSKQIAEGLALYAKCRDRLDQCSANTLYSFYHVLSGWDNAAKYFKVDTDKIFKICADKGNAQCAYEYGLKNQSTHPDIFFKYISIAAEKNYSPALYQLALAYKYGIGVPEKRAKSIEFLDKCIGIATKFGEKHLIAMCNLQKAELLAAGNGVPKDIVAADEYYRQGAFLNQETVPALRKFTNEHFFVLVKQTQTCAELKLPSALWMLGLFQSNYSESKFHPFMLLTPVNAPDDRFVYIKGLQDAKFPIEKDDKIAIANAVITWEKAVEAGSPEAAFALACVNWKLKDNHQETMKWLIMTIRICQRSQNMEIRYKHLMDYAAHALQILAVKMKNKQIPYQADFTRRRGLNVPVN